MTLEEELLADLDVFIKTGHVSIEASSENYFIHLAKIFPLVGSKINWDGVAGSVIATTSNKNDVTEWVNFFREIVDKKSLKGMVVYVNDSAIECALTMPVEILSKCIRQILEFPSHHYFIGEDYSWCMSFTMEGDMVFGFRP